MKKLLSFILVCITVLLMTGCKETAVPQETEHVHVWKPATCAAPETCVRCRITKGEPLPHKLQIGVCPDCNTYLNEDRVNTLKSELTAIVVDLKTNNAFIQKTYNTPHITQEKLAEAIITAQAVFDKHEPALERIILLCDEFEELTNVQAYLEAARSCYPKKVENPTDADLKAFYTDSTDCFQKVFNAMNLLNTMFNQG